MNTFDQTVKKVSGSPGGIAQGHCAGNRQHLNRDAW